MSTKRARESDEIVDGVEAHKKFIAEEKKLQARLDEVRALIKKYSRDVYTYDDFVDTCPEMQFSQEDFDFLLEHTRDRLYEELGKYTMRAMEDEDTMIINRMRDQDCKDRIECYNITKGNWIKSGRDEKELDVDKEIRKYYDIEDDEDIGRLFSTKNPLMTKYVCPEEFDDICCER